MGATALTPALKLFKHALFQIWNSALNKFLREYQNERKDLFGIRDISARSLRRR